MIGPVDVLAEMQADIDALEQRVLDGEFTLSRGYDKVNRLRGLRAAVAELIEAQKATRRELHACQAVIHLAGGFDPAYVTGAQAAIKQADAALANVGSAP